MTDEGLSIGEMAAATGMSVRMLHHYDSLGLVSASARTAAGHRRYLPADVERLYRVQALRALGMSLRDVGTALRSAGGTDLSDLVARQLAQVRRDVDEQRALLARLESLQDRLRADPDPADGDLVAAIAALTALRSDLRHDYDEQSDRYDRTRGASPSVLEPVARAIDGAPGRVLLDVGGGTGNYAAALRERGWQPVVLDASAAMRDHARAKGLATVDADATALPLADHTADAVVMISVLHQVADWRAALDEAARVLRPGGRLAVMGLAADHLREVAWAFDLFPSARGFALDRRPSLAEMTGHLPSTTTEPMWFTDLEDASIGALCAFPEAVLDERTRRQTSFFERLERDNPAELAVGLQRLRDVLAAGQDPRAPRAGARARLGDATVLRWVRPADDRSRRR